jgi:hypothetical protein
MAEQVDSVALALGAQAGQAERIGSPLYARLLEGLLRDHDAGGITAEVLAGVSEKPIHDALPLRYLATGHRLALAGDAPALARYYGSCGGEWHGEDLTPTFLDLVHAQRTAFDIGVRRNVQTNEVGRAPVLASGFTLIARRHVPELDVLEIGSSAGLLSRWDRYYYNTASSRFGDASSPLRFDRSWWREPAPNLAGEVNVVRKRASDISPIDVTTADGQLTMLSFVWPDQSERISRLRAAIEVAQHVHVPVERADAGDWLTEQLVAGLRANTATVVFHAIVWQYLPDTTRDRMRAALFSAGEDAHEGAPLLWLRMEPATAAFANLRLTTWPGGTDEVLAEVGYHGADIRWLVTD